MVLYTRVWVRRFAVLAALSCGSAQRFEEELESSRVLAAEAVKLAFDNGGFQAMQNQAVAASYSFARNRFEAGGRTLTPDESQVIEQIIRAVLNEVYPRQVWEEALRPLYEDALTREELQEIVAFYKSDLGRKALTIQATLMTGGSAIGERLMQSRREEFTRRLMDELTRALNRPTGG